MCTRRQAISIIVGQKHGTIAAIKRQIGDRLYDSFVILGFIEERPVLNNVASESDELIEWEATRLATQKSEFYRLLPE